MARIHELMSAQEPPLHATEMAEIELTGFFIDKAAHNALLETALNELATRKIPAGTGPRLMLLGSVGNLEAISLIESFGARVVTDDYCTGTRYYQSEISGDGDRLGSLAAHMIEKPQCPLKDMPDRKRLAHLSNRIDEFGVEGVLYTIQRQCDSHGMDYPATESLMREKNIPIMKLELDQSVPAGQLRTRIEAFLEMIGC